MYSLSRFTPAPRAKPAATPDFWPASSLDEWALRPRESFRTWLSEKRIVGNRNFRETSYETYCAMFSSWLEFLTCRDVGVLEVSTKDARAFFDHHRLEPVSRRRYLQLLDKVYRHLRLNGWTGENPMRVELSLERTLPPEWPKGLTSEELGKLVRHLSLMQGWKGTRDRAILALTVGAGLRNNELVGLTRRALEPNVNHTIHLQPQGVHRSHTTTVLPQVELETNGTVMLIAWRGWLTEWTSLRDEMGIPGSWAIPSVASGKAYSASGVFRRISGWFEAAGIQPGQAGVNVLRNTFAHLAIQSGQYPLEQIQEFLGHEHSVATMRYLKAGVGAR